MIQIIEKKPYSAPTIIEFEAKCITDLERTFETNYTQQRISADLYLLAKTDEDYEETNLILGDQVISGTVYVVKGTPSELTSVTTEDLVTFKSLARFIEFN
ncbi:hypothetical protein [Fusibacter ferrireducens]|uniref:Uncharacterized protein n=1 Tax=Fusibacter ferrireducens TaxID=2785058 RepID=A0ABR9ZV07_9FIRM|nr:hypothetical protein [Fusibacter ferrireducens]MBF4694297.1 hypothetical protein [Fusibacter ferrireducens]